MSHIGTSQDGSSNHSDVQLQCPQAPRQKPLPCCFCSSETLQDDLMWRNTGNTMKNIMNRRQRGQKVKEIKKKVSIMKFLDELAHEI